MEQRLSIAAGASSYLYAGLAAIISGILGIIAYGALMTAVMTRTSWIPSQRVKLFFQAHDVVVIFQFLLLVFVAFALRNLLRAGPRTPGKLSFAMSVGAILLVALFLILGLARIVSDGFYMLPQGIVGLSLIVVNWRLSGLIPKWLRWFGMVVGLGLVLVGVAWLGLSYVYPDQWVIPAVPIENRPEVVSRTNENFHQLLFVGSFLGVATLPLWTLLTGFQLLKRKHPDGPC